MVKHVGRPVNFERRWFDYLVPSQPCSERSTLTSKSKTWRRRGRRQIEKAGAVHRPYPGTDEMAKPGKSRSSSPRLRGRSMRHLTTRTGNPPLAAPMACISDKYLTRN